MAGIYRYKSLEYSESNTQGMLYVNKGGFGGDSPQNVLKLINLVKKTEHYKIYHIVNNTSRNSHYDFVYI